MRIKHLYFLVIILSICSCSKFETSENYYSTYKEAANQGIIQRGWMPDIIPKSTRDIYEKHNIDTNATIAWFQYEQGLNSTLLDKCQQLNVTDIKWPKIKAKWWPKDLTNVSKLASPRFIFYQCSEVDGYFAINTNETEAYFWRIYG